jgi:hypothetical protein
LKSLNVQLEQALLEFTQALMEGGEPEREIVDNVIANIEERTLYANGRCAWTDARNPQCERVVGSGTLSTGSALRVRSKVSTSVP